MTTLVNRAKMTTATTGTGVITLGSAVDGYQTFAAAGVADADVVRYVIEDGNNWEIGTGTYTATGTTLSRTVSESSNADAALNLTGSAVVYVSAAAEDIPSLELYAENPSSPTAPSATGTNAVAIGSGVTAGNIDAIALGSGAISNGTYSVAMSRSYAVGSDSFAAVIASNSSSYGATGSRSVALAYRSKSSGSYSFACGYQNIASGSYSVALGRNSTAAGPQGFAAGYLAEAAQDNTVALGFRPKADTDGKFAFAAGVFAATGDAQTGTFVLRSDTTDATPEALTTTNNSIAGTLNQIILPNNSAYAFHGTIVARQQASAGTACAAWKIEGLIRREGSAGTTVLVNSATTVLDNTPSWGMALSADTTNGGLAITVTGAAATNIRWVASVTTAEVTY